MLLVANEPSPNDLTMAWFGLFCSLVWVVPFVSQQAGAVGIKRRMQQAEDNKNPKPKDHPAPPREPEQAAGSSTDPPRGGVKQRMSQAAKHGGHDKPKHLPLRDTLLKGWSTGDTTSARVLEIAAGATHQGAEGLSDMASLGAHNAFRSLQHVFGYPGGAPALTWLEIPTKSSSRTPYPLLLPYELFHSYYKDRKKDWLKP